MVWDGATSGIGTCGIRIWSGAKTWRDPTVSPNTVTLNVGVGTVCALTVARPARGIPATTRNVAKISANRLMPRPSDSRFYMEDSRAIATKSVAYLYVVQLCDFSPYNPAKTRPRTPISDASELHLRGTIIFAL